MFQSFYQGHPLLDLPVLALWLFVITFVVVAVCTWLVGEDNAEVQRSRFLPLNEGGEATRREDR